MSRWIRDHYEWLLSLIWENSCPGAPNVDLQDTFASRGGDRADHEAMLDEVQELFGVEPPARDDLTLEQLAASVRHLRRRAALPQKPFVVPGSQSGRTPLFYLHGVTGEPMFDPKLLRFDFGRPVVSVRSVGMDLEEKPLRTIEDTVDRYIANLTEMGTVEPYIIAGSSSSAILAFAMAQRLESNGSVVAYVGLLEPPPMRPYPHTLSEDVAHRIGELCLGRGVDYIEGNPDGSARALIAAHALPPYYTPELVRRHGEVFGHNRRASYCYEPQGRFNGNAVLYESRDFGCGSDPFGSLDVPTERLPAYEQFWAQYLRPQTVVRRQNCEHRSIDGTLLIRQWIRDDIDEALRRVGVSSINDSSAREQ